MVSCSSCQSSKTTTNIPTTTANTSYKQISPEFNADSAYLFVEKQVAFGPRTPNSAAHRECGDYLVTKLKEFGAEVIEQKAKLKKMAANKRILFLCTIQFVIFINLFF